jgi:hypothetical protein
MSLLKFRELIEESLDRVEKEISGKQTDLQYYYLKGLEDAYKYMLDMTKILEAKEGHLVRDECDG